MTVVNSILLPTGGVAASPIALLVWFFLVLTAAAATWGFVGKFIHKGGGRRA